MTMTGKHSFQPDNRGLSLVELLVVIAIMSVLTGVAGMSIYLAASRNCEKCAKEIDTLLERARMFAMSKDAGSGNYMLHIDLKDGGAYGLNTSHMDVADETKKLQKNVTIEVFETAADGTDSSAGDITSVGIRFDPSTGKVAEVTYDGAASDPEVLKLKCSHDDRTVTVVLVKNTGKHFVSYE
ncbi:MAG: prepilin-type N-terminal cleavage/methylation domain-containing protein [Lachnospiraceae bacterium]|nr:prepilin-type N-terminal cleavage/methylation domain-containing protein [Lachnospiraceae bacterium]